MSVENRLAVARTIDEIGGKLDDLSQIFYRELFQTNAHMRQVFSGNILFLNRKFSNLMGTLKNVKHLEKISDSVAQMGERHLHHYSAQVEHFPLLKTALINALDEFLGERFTTELREAWDQVYDEVAAIMQDAMKKADRRDTPRTEYNDDTYDPELLNDIGGEEVILNIHLNFYHEIFQHPWLGYFFLGKHESILAQKQTDFMVASFGGPNNYKGDTPAFVHMHMFITDEIADLREELLRKHILAAGLSEEIADRWMKVDHAFRAGLVKKSVDECVMKCMGQMPIVAKKPDNF